MTRSQRSSISVPSVETRESKELRLLELHEVCASCDEDQLEELLKTGKYDAIINYKDPDWGNRTALHWCCMKGRGEMARRLLEKGAHPGLRTEVGWTPAHYAAELGKTHILRLLHGSNAPISRKDLFGDTPRRVAEIYGFMDAVEFLKTAEDEYEERRRRQEQSGEAEQYDDEDIDWCIQNNVLSPSDVFSLSDQSSIRENSIVSDTSKKRRRRSSASSSGKESTKTRVSKNKNVKSKSGKSLLAESLHSIQEN